MIDQSISVTIELDCLVSNTDVVVIYLIFNHESVRFSVLFVSATRFDGNVSCNDGIEKTLLLIWLS